MALARVTQLSVVIPARNEAFLARTVLDILERREADTEVIVALDGQWSDPGLPQDSRLSVIYLPESIGQRAATNAAARVASGKYVLKCDAHCAFDQGFDRKMLEAMQPDWTMVPLMRNLHAFDWVCSGGHRRYQGPSGPCQECGEPTERDIVWHAKRSPQSTAYCFDREPHFQYHSEFRRRPEGKGDLTETMSLQGSCWMLSAERYWGLAVCDERFGSWGSQGIEVAVKTWLSGGRVVCNQRTWYAHMFRTQGGDFGFPYPLAGGHVDRAKATARDQFVENKWPGAKHTLGWLIRRFAPVPDWPSKGIIYYTDNRLPIRLAKRCQRQIARAKLPITSCSRKPMGHFGKNVVLPGSPGPLQMFRQILAALEACEQEVVFFCEHDVLYHDSHFDFMPPRADAWYYNTNVWKLLPNGRAARADDCRQVSGICVNRDLAVEHYRERVRRVERDGFSAAMGYEPGTHHRGERVDDGTSERWESEFPNVDIRHGGNLSPTRTAPDQFRNARFAAGWQEADEIPGWDGEGF